MKMPDARTQFITSMFLFAIALAAIIESPASAADPEFDYSSVDAPLSSTTVQELRQWASYYWEHEETGIWSPEAQAFEFTHPEEMPPGFVLFGDAIELFEDLYQDQLILEPGDHFYGIEQLIDDDPEVCEQFKLYTTTGLLMMGRHLIQQRECVHKLRLWKHPLSVSSMRSATWSISTTMQL